jgi:2-polyprenyl-6-methoxyphenol hydroxylase-like FAD-dependent oxidoreductase
MPIHSTGDKTRLDTNVLIIGGGPAGLILALSLKEIGVECQIYESVPELRAVGVGINLLPHAVRELDQLGLVPALDAVGIRTLDSSYFNRFGQHVFTEPAGEAAGYPWPQFSLLRGDMHMVFLEAVRARLGDDAVITGQRCVSVDISDDSVTAHFVDRDGEALPAVRAAVVIGCDGINSTLRRQFYPDEGEPLYSGVTLWRGITPFPKLLSGANVARIGWIPVGKVTVYPCRNDINAAGDQLMNFVVSLQRPRPETYDWHSVARLEDFFESFADWTFDWLDVPALLKKTDPILVFPMVDRDPLPTWTFGRATLMGDAAHPMYPRGSNGAGQAILDARFLAGCIKRRGVTEDALQEYDATRVEATSNVVRMNRQDPPDVILREVHERGGDRPFEKVTDIISAEELKAIGDRYKLVAGFDIEALKQRPSFV